MKKGSFKNMKKQNQRNILFLIKKEDGISRAKIAEKLDISRATVTNIVKELLEMELVTEAKMGKSSGGRRPTLLKLNPAGAQVVAFEWGIEYLKAVLLDFEAEIILKDKIKIKNNSFAEYKNKSLKLIKKYEDYLAEENNII